MPTVVRADLQLANADSISVTPIDHVHGRRRARSVAVMRRKGSCLCGALAYEVEGDFDGVWMCHCSNCRKASGGSGNTIVIVPRERFRWLSGEDHRVTYALRPTYTVTRCKTCGTPLPAEEDEKNVYLTAGTLDDPLGAAIKNHIFCGSRADWDRDADGARYFVERSSGPECVNTGHGHEFRALPENAKPA